MEEIKKKKGNTGLIVLIVILIILLLGALGYIGYDLYQHNKSEKEDITESKETPKTEELVEGNVFDFDEVKFNKDDLSKQLKVAFNGKNHDIKIKLVKKNEEIGDAGYTDFSFEVYLDNNLIDTISGGTIDQLDSYYLDDFEGFIYIIDSKYFAVVTPVVSIAGSPGFDMNFYNENSRVGDSIKLKIVGQGLCKDKDCTEPLNEIENVEFDGHSVRYWGQDCDLKSNVKYEVTFDGTKVNREIIEKTGNTYGSGAAAC